MKRSRWLSLVVALVLALGVAGAAGVASWRASRPSKTLKVSFDDGGGLFGRNGKIARMLRGPEMRFAGAHRLVVAEEFQETAIDHRAHVWSLETGLLERTLPIFPEVVDPGSTRALVRDDDKSPLHLLDLETGATQALAPRRESPLAFSPTEDAVAVLASSRHVELRSLHDGSVVRSLVVPEPKLRPESTFHSELLFSARGDRLAVIADTWPIQFCNLASETWGEAGSGWPVGFTANGLVVVPYEPGQWQLAPVLVARDGSRHPIEGASEHTPYALSASGEWFATLRAIPGKPTFETVVQSLETGEVRRRVATRPGRSVRCLALSPDGERLAVAYESSRTVTTVEDSLKPSDELVDIWEIP